MNPILVLPLAALLAAGCLTDSQGRSRRGRNAGPTPEELAAQQREARVQQLEATVRALQSQLDGMGSSVNQVATDSDTIRRATDARAADALALREDVDALSARIRKLETQLAQTQQSLSDSLAREHRSIVDEVNKSIRESDARTERAIRDAVAQASRSARQSGGGGRAANPPVSGNYYEHVVESGQTLGAIAKAYKVSVDTIVKANRLKSANAIYAGQTLVIPANP